MSVADVLPFLLPRPELSMESEVRVRISEFVTDARRTDRISEIDIVGLPKWQLLCEMAERDDVVLHGSGNPSIEVFEPRRNEDANPFGAQEAVYAASDGIWPMFYAILDRSAGYSIHNGCLRFVEGDGSLSIPYYFFSVDESALARRPFGSGFVYVLPKATFVRDPMSELGGVRFISEHWASLEPVRPLGIVSINPEEFPFLGQIRGHHPETLRARMASDPERFPWVDEQYK